MANRRPRRSPDPILDRIEEARRTDALSLDLSYKQLLALPEAIGQLTALQLLVLTGNQLTALPEAIGRLTALQLLVLTGNQLTALPESFGQLTVLQNLLLSQNQLTALPGAIGRLAALQNLDLSQNQLTALPEAIAGLTALQSLNLSQNQLTALPDVLGRLPALQHLYLHGIEALGIPPEVLGPTWDGVLKKKAQAAKSSDILQYYFRRKGEPTRRLNEAKALIVGQGGVGKTSLVKRLVKDEYDPDEPRSEGINIVYWQIPGRPDPGHEGERIRLNIWDFGGQEIMHATHQFFLTKRSLYLVVLDARKGENESNIHYWLKIILSYSGDSPVLVVTNKCETSPLELNENRLKLDYAPNLRGFFKVSCATGAGVEELRKAMIEQVNDLPFVYDELPGSYFAVKEKLSEEARTKHFLDITEYERLCHQHGLYKRSEQELLLRFLHDLGNVLNFHDPGSPFQMRETNILNPEWVTGGVYKILNKTLFQIRLTTSFSVRFEPEALAVGSPFRP